MSLSLISSVILIKMLQNPHDRDHDQILCLAHGIDLFSVFQKLFWDAVGQVHVIPVALEKLKHSAITSRADFRMVKIGIERIF